VSLSLSMCVSLSVCASLSMCVCLSMYDVNSLKFGYNRINQYIHLISNTTASSPVDLWQTSNYHIKPQTGDQFSLGYFRNFLGNSYESSIEIYYKTVDNLVDYKDGATLLLNEALEADLLQGIGRAYGMEIMLKKQTGRLTGSVNYTLSRTERKIDGPTESEKINNGEYFPANYDKPHDVAVIATYRITRRWTFSTNFIYNTGRPTTFPDSKFKYGGAVFANYEDRNQDRIPDYHRLDVSITLDGSHKKNKRWEGSWTLSVYNLYGRDNSFSIFLRPERGFLPQARKLSIITSPIPALTYNFKF